MPFHAEFLNNATKLLEVKSVDTDFKEAEKLLREALAKIAERNPRVNPKDVDIYIHGSYANKTNIYFPANLEVVVELKRTPDYDPDAYPHEPYRLYNNYFVETLFEYNPVDFAAELLSALQEVTGNTCTQQSQIILMPKSAKVKHDVEILPAFTFNYVEQTEETGPQPDAKVFKGVLLYDHNEAAHIVTFPRLHQKHGAAKDTATNGGFLTAVRLFKTINAIGARESDFHRVRGYFVQCLLFNVPNQLFIAPDVETMFYKILNYLLNAEFEDFVCQNLVWQLFGEANEFWDDYRAHRFVKEVRKFHDGFPPTRTTLA